MFQSFVNILDDVRFLPLTGALKAFRFLFIQVIKTYLPSSEVSGSARAWIGAHDPGPGSFLSLSSPTRVSDSTIESLPRLSIFCDGSNFLSALKPAGIHYPIDIPRFARILAKHGRGYLLVKFRYYSAPHPNPNSSAYREQERVFDILRKASNTTLVLGRHESRRDPVTGARIHVEKEVDVHLAIDMVTGALRNEYDAAMLITGDTDQVPAVERVRESGKRVIWCYFKTQEHSIELRDACNDKLLLTEPFLRTCRRYNS